MAKKKQKKLAARKPQAPGEETAERPKDNRKDHRSEEPLEKAMKKPRTLERRWHALPSDSDDGVDDVNALAAIQSWGVGKLQECEALVKGWKTLMNDSVNGPTGAPRRWRGRRRFRR